MGETLSIPYGSEATNRGELLLPDGPGPHPVAMLIHGGCWLANLGAMENYRSMAAVLAEDGIATWNIEYRRVGHSGGGWPGTFHDLGAALDYLEILARNHAISLDRVAALGHSSGGHFAAWLAARPQLPAASEIRGDPKVRLAGVVLADAFIDPRVMDSRGIDGALYCGEPVLARLIGAEPVNAPGRLREISPLAWLPWDIPQSYVISSRRYPVTPGRVLADGRTTMTMPDYPAQAEKVGDSVDLRVIDSADHFDFIDEPGSDAFQSCRAAVNALVGQISGGR